MTSVLTRLASTLFPARPRYVVPTGLAFPPVALPAPTAAPRIVEAALVRPDFGQRATPPEHRLAVRLQIARNRLAQAEGDLDALVNLLDADRANLSFCGRSDREVLREANERVFAARYALDEVRLETLDGENCDRLQPNDEDVMGDALLRRAHENAERLPDLTPPMLTTRCVGVGTARSHF